MSRRRSSRDTEGTSPRDTSRRSSRDTSARAEVDLRSGRAVLATVPVTVKLTPQDVAWLDDELARRRAAGREWHTPLRCVSRPTRSLLIRELVEQARKRTEAEPETLDLFGSDAPAVGAAYPTARKGLGSSKGQRGTHG